MTSDHPSSSLAHSSASFPTTLLDRVLSFLPASTLLECSEVNRSWYAESQALSLWRLLLDAREKELKEKGIRIITAPFPLSLAGFTLEETKRIVLTPLSSIDTCPVPSSLQPMLAKAADVDREKLQQKREQAKETERQRRERVPSRQPSSSTRAEEVREGVTSPCDALHSGKRELDEAKRYAFAIRELSRRLVTANPLPSLSKLNADQGEAKRPAVPRADTLMRWGKGGHSTGVYGGAFDSKSSPTDREVTEGPSLFQRSAQGLLRDPPPAKKVHRLPPHTKATTPLSTTTTHAKWGDERSSDVKSPLGRGQSSPPHSPPVSANRQAHHHQRHHSKADPLYNTVNGTMEKRPTAAKMRTATSFESPRQYPAPDSMLCPPPPSEASTSSLSVSSRLFQPFNSPMPAHRGGADSPSASNSGIRLQPIRPASDAPTAESSQSNSLPAITSPIATTSTAVAEAMGEERLSSSCRPTEPSRDRSHPQRPCGAEVSPQSEMPSLTATNTESFLVPPPPPPVPSSSAPASPPPPPPRRMTASHSESTLFSAGLQMPFTAIGAAPSSPSATIPLSYESVSQEDLLLHHSTILVRSMEKLDEMLSSERRVLLQDDELLEGLESDLPSSRFFVARELCQRFLCEVKVFEQIVCQALLRDASRVQRKVLPTRLPKAAPSTGSSAAEEAADAPSPPPRHVLPLPTAIQSFVQMELLTLKCRGSAADKLWEGFKYAFGIDDAYYDAVDVLLDWGVEWDGGRAYTEPIEGQSEGARRRARRQQEESLADLVQGKIAPFVASMERLIQLKSNWGHRLPWDQVMGCVNDQV